MPGTVENRRAERRTNIVQGTVLVIDDEADIRELLELSLLRMGLAVECAGSVAAAKQLLQSKRYELCLTDMRLPDGDGLELVRFIGVQCADLPVAVITAFGSTENAVAALKAGAFDYLTKPLSLDQLRTLVKSALSLPQKTAPAKSGEGQLLGSSPGIEQVRSKIEKLARSQAPIYVTGESGSGKELAARLIHGKGSRRERAFVPVNCGACPGPTASCPCGSPKERRRLSRATIFPAILASWRTFWSAPSHSPRGRKSNPRTCSSLRRLGSLVNREPPTPNGRCRNTSIV